MAPLSNDTGTAFADASPGTKAETVRDGAAQCEASAREPASAAKEQNCCTEMPPEATIAKEVELLCAIHKEIAAVAIDASSLTNKGYSTIQVLSVELLSHFAKVRRMKLDRGDAWQ